MSNRLAISIVVGLGVLAFGLLWFELGGPAEQARKVAAPGVAAAGSGDTSVAAAEVVSAEARPSEPPAMSDVEPVVADATTREAARTPYELELDAGWWVEGSVVLPEGTPADEEPYVVARGRKLENGAFHRVAVEPMGSFRIAFGEKTRKGRVQLDARYLYLEESPRFDVREAQHLALEPRLGGFVHGRIGLPEDCPVEAEELVGLPVQLNGHRSNDASRMGSIEADLTYAFGGVPSGDYILHIRPNRLQTVRTEVLTLRKGEELVHDVSMNVGAVVAGKILDAGGQPVAGAEVSARPTRNTRRRTKSEADGSFLLEGVAPGMVTLTVKQQGFEEHNVALGALEDRARREDLEVLLDRGLGLSGRVTWTDGTPAGDVKVVVQKNREDQWGIEDATSSRTNADGSFTLTGLVEGSYTVAAHGRRKDSEGGTSRRQRLRATLHDVVAGTDGLELVLGGGNVLRGVVVDDLGRPLERCFVRARRAGTPGFFAARGTDILSRSVRDAADGAFVLDGLDTGKWIVQATARGHGPSEEVPVDASAALPELTLVCGRAGQVRGVVRAANGAPIADAIVSLEAVTTGQDFHVGSDVHARTDAEGVFVLEDVDPGEATLTAEADGHAPSDPLLFELEAGGEVLDVELRLRATSALIVQVVGGGEREVQVFGEDHATARTDADGRAVIRDLPPGTYTVQVAPTTEEVRAVGGSSEREDGFDILELSKHGIVLAEGETLEVVLERDALSPISVSGRVVAGGQALEKAHVWFSYEGPGSNPTTRTDTDGGYGVLLPGPGEYRLAVSTRQGMSYRETVQVPDVRSFELDIVIATGAIAGRVYGPDGAPAAGVTVTALSGRQRDRGRTGTDGSYLLDLVPVGTYTVNAGGARSSRGGSDPSHGPASIDDVTVTAGATVRGVDLRLPDGGTLRGQMRTPDGSLVRAVLYRSDPEGRMLEQIGWSRDQGRFEIGGLPVGTLHVFARGDGNASTLATVEIRAGDTTELELVLHPTGRLMVEVSGANGATRVNVRGADGAPWPGHARRGNTWTFQSVVVGPCTVTVTSGDTERIVETQVAANEETRVEVSIED